MMLSEVISSLRKSRSSASKGLFADIFRPPAAQQASQATSYAPPPGAPPASGMQSLAKPALPERKPSAVGTGPQPDDLEDVKRVSPSLTYA
jgi:hypothetical protein